MRKSLIEFAQYSWDGTGVSPEAILRRDGSQAPFAAMQGCPAWFGWRAGKAMSDEGLSRPTSIQLVQRLPRVIDLLGPPNLTALVKMRDGSWVRAVLEQCDDPWQYGRVRLRLTDERPTLRERLRGLGA